MTWSLLVREEAEEKYVEALLIQMEEAVEGGW